MKEQILKYFFLSLLYIFSFSSIIYSQWTQQNNGLKFWHRGNAIDACDSNTAVIAVDSTLFETEDGGNNWQKVINPLVGNGELWKLQMEALTGRYSFTIRLKPGLWIT